VVTALNIPTPTNTPGGQNYSFANRFSTTIADTAQKVRWWRSGTSPFPNEVRLYDQTADADVFHLGPSAITWTLDTGSWYVADVPMSGGSFPAIPSGHTFFLTFYNENSGAVQAYATGGAPTTSSGYTWLSSRFQSGNVQAPSADNGSGTTYGVDLVTGLYGGTGGGGGGGVTNADLASWLSNASATNTHQSDGLPWQTKVDTADIRTKVTNGFNLTGGLQALSDSLAHTIQMASDWLASGSTTIFTDLKNRILGASGGGGSAFYGAGGTQVAEGVEALLARSTNAQVGFPASPWEMTAETDFDGCLAWAQPADLYTVTFATTPPTIPNNGQCGVPVRYRLAWWTPLNGEFAQERHWIDFEKSHLVDPAGRMPGLLLQTYLGGGGHVEAWTLNV
jgi:hypothetical protein